MVKSSLSDVEWFFMEFDVILTDDRSSALLNKPLDTFELELEWYVTDLNSCTGVDVRARFVPLGALSAERS